MVDAFGEWGWHTLREGEEGEWNLIRTWAQRYEVSQFCLASAESMRGDLVRGNNLLKTVVSKEERIKGYLVINPNHLEESAEEMKKYLSGGDFVGILLPPARLARPLNSWRTIEMLKMARRYDVPLVAFLETESDAGGLVSLVRRYPGLRSLAVLLPGCDWFAALRIISEVPNVAVIVTGLLTERGLVEQAVSLLGERRVLFGSGITRVHICRGIGMVLEADVTDRQRQMILEGNARAWLGL